MCCLRNAEELQVRSPVLTPFGQLAVKRKCMFCAGMRWSMKKFEEDILYSWKSGALIAISCAASGTPRNFKYDVQSSRRLVNSHLPFQDASVSLAPLSPLMALVAADLTTVI